MGVLKYVKEQVLGLLQGNKTILVGEDEIENCTLCTDTFWLHRLPELQLSHQSYLCSILALFQLCSFAFVFETAATQKKSVGVM